MSDHAGLKRAAEAAIAEGLDSGQRWPEGDDWFEPELISAEMDFVKAASPKAILELIAENAKFRECLNLIMEEIPHAKQPRKAGNAPGHCHEIPGVWDSDNGAKAGKECGWCKTWNLALSLS